MKCKDNSILGEVVLLSLLSQPLHVTFSLEVTGNQATGLII